MEKVIPRVRIDLQVFKEGFYIKFYDLNTRRCLSNHFRIGVGENA
jgi:hypothetical protein